MFEPNSIKSLLNRRQSSRISSAKTSNEQENKPREQSNSTTKAEIEYDSIIETKVIIKQIDGKVENLREWRAQQKELMEEKIRCNSEVAKVEINQHIQYLERQAQKEQQELDKIVKKLNEKSEGIKIQEFEEQYDTDKIFEVLKQTDNIREALKNYQTSTQPVENSEFISQLQSLSNIFKKEDHDYQRQAMAATPQQEINSQDLQKEMDEIDKELKQIEDLLKDEEPAHPE